MEKKYRRKGGMCQFFDNWSEHGEIDYQNLSAAIHGRPYREVRLSSGCGCNSVVSNKVADTPIKEEEEKKRLEEEEEKRFNRDYKLWKKE